MSNESELCRRPRALANFLHLRQPGLQAQRQIDDFNRLEPLHNFPKPIELHLLIPHSIGVKKSWDEAARPEDITNRMQFQRNKFIELSARNALTPEWHKFGQKHLEAIASI